MEDGALMKQSGFILIFIGTIGLLVNEFAIEWGSIATLIFALLNLVGLSLLLIVHRSSKS